MKYAELIGWASSAILLLTIGRQVYTQWKTRATAGVSHWLFIGQLTASTGFTIYSLLLRNWVYVASNVALLITAVVGQLIYSRNRNIDAVLSDADSARPPTVTATRDTASSQAVNNRETVNGN